MIENMILNDQKTMMNNNIQFIIKVRKKHIILTFEKLKPEEKIN